MLAVIDYIFVRILIFTFNFFRILINDNDNDKRLGLTVKADQPDHKKYNTPKI